MRERRASKCILKKTDMWQNKHDMLYLYRQIESRDIAPKRRHKKKRRKKLSNHGGARKNGHRGYAAQFPHPLLLRKKEREITIFQIRNDTYLVPHVEVPDRVPPRRAAGEPRQPKNGKIAQKKPNFYFLPILEL